MAAGNASSGFSAALFRALMMSNLRRTSQEVGAAGEQEVGLDLRRRGYEVNVDTRAPGATDIVAWSPIGRLRVQVKTAQAPAQPGWPSLSELNAIRLRARQENAVPWLARVQVSWWLERMIPMMWYRLN